MKWHSSPIIGTAALCMLFYAVPARAQSIDEYKSAVAADTNNCVAHYKLGVKYTLEKMYDSALVEYGTAVELYPRYAEAHHAIYCTEILKDTSLLSEFTKETPSPEKAPKVAEIKEHNNVAFYTNPFFDQSMAGLFIKAQVFYKPLRYFETPDFRVQFFLRLDGFNEFFRGQYGQAIGDLTVMISEDPEFMQAYYFRGLAYAHLGFFQNAINDFQPIIDKMQQYNETKVLPVYLKTSHLYYMIGYCYLQLHRNYPAEDAFKAALSQDLGLYMADFQLCLADCLKGSFNPAIEKINAAIAIKPEDAILHYDKASLLIQQNRYPEAVTELATAISISPRYAPLYLSLARAYDRMGKQPEAVTRYQQYIAHASTRDAGNIQEAREAIARLEQ